MTSITLLLMIVILVLLWQSSQRSRDTAIETARQTCNRQGVQFLDGTAALQGIKPFLTGADGPGLQRTYTFDYSEDGITRRTGCIIIRNTRVSAVLLDG